MSQSLSIFTQLNGFTYSNLTVIILFIKYSYQIRTTCTQHYGFKLVLFLKFLGKKLNSFIWPISRTLTGTNTLGQNCLESNGNEGVHHISQTPRQEPRYQIQLNVIPRTLNGFKYCNLTLIILFDINHLLTHCLDGFKYCYLSAIDPPSK